MSETKTEPRSSYTVSERFTEINKMMCRLRELAQHGYQFAVVQRDNEWELSYVEKAPF